MSEANGAFVPTPGRPEERDESEVKKKMKVARWQDGGAEGVRTPDLLNAIQALYQLSYDPIWSEVNLECGGELCQRDSLSEL